MISTVSQNSNRSYQIIHREPISVGQRVVAVALAAIGIIAFIVLPLAVPNMEAALTAFFIGGACLIAAVAILAPSSPCSFPVIHSHRPLLSRSVYCPSIVQERRADSIRQEPRVQLGGGHFQPMRGPAFTFSEVKPPHFSLRNERVRVGGHDSAMRGPDLGRNASRFSS